MEKISTAPTYDIISGEITEGMGPAMRALTNDRMRAFVIALQDGPDLNYARAAREAGYGGKNPQSIHNQAYALAHDPRIIEAIIEEAKRKRGAASGWAMSQLINQGQAAKSDGDKQKALLAVIDRTPGLGVVTTHKIDVTHKDERTPKEMLAAYFHVAKQLGIAEPMKLLGAPPPDDTASGPQTKFEAVDAEFTEVEEDLGPL